mmetsp:Transcript_23221/g.67754  ORF Transcript_23221/g.67754 Transcript_23221/m.67754 type:complete len:94 (-) Transcript_23221:2829-3110(-)
MTLNPRLHTLFELYLSSLCTQYVSLVVCFFTASQPAERGGPPPENPGGLDSDTTLDVRGRCCEHVELANNSPLRRGESKVCGERRAKVLTEGN